MFVEEMPWWKSKIIVGAAVSIITKILVLAGVTGEIDTGTSQQFADLILLLVGTVGDLVAVASRIKQKRAPVITLKQ